MNIRKIVKHAHTYQRPDSISLEEVTFSYSMSATTRLCDCDFGHSNCAAYSDKTTDYYTNKTFVSSYTINKVQDVTGKSTNVNMREKLTHTHEYVKVVLSISRFAGSYEIITPVACPEGHSACWFGSSGRPIVDISMSTEASTSSTVITKNIRMINHKHELPNTREGASETVYTAAGYSDCPSGHSVCKAVLNEPAVLNDVSLDSSETTGLV